MSAHVYRQHAGQREAVELADLGEKLWVIATN